MAKRELSYTDGGKQSLYSHYGKQNKGFLESYKNRIIIWSSSPTAGNIPEQNCKSKRYVYPYIHCITVHIAKT